MKLTQAYKYLNDTIPSLLGEESIIQEDLSNIVEIGKEIDNANLYDPLTTKLINRIGRDVVESKAFKVNSLGIVKDAWEYGSIKRKIRVNMPENYTNQSYGLRNGASVDPNIFYGIPEVRIETWNAEDTWEVRQSFTDTELKQSFTSAEALASFLGAIETAIKNKLLLDVQKLATAAINNMIGETVYYDYEGDDLGESSGIRAVNLEYLYNQSHDGDDLTADECMVSPDFWKFAAAEMGKYISRMQVVSTIYNMKSWPTQTDRDNLKIYMLADCKRNCDVYLRSDVFNKELVDLPEAIEVPYWQGVGGDFSFDDVSKVSVKTTSNHTVAVPHVLAVMMDDEAVAIGKEASKITSNYNAAGEFTTYYYKNKAEYMNDPFENFVVFFLADAED